MLSKFKINLILVLCMLSLISIGFSSWNITLDAINVDANISVDNVVNSEDYIYLDTTKGDNNTGISCFKYKNNGYGKIQLQEAYRRIVLNDVNRIIVTTNIGLFPAQQMYEGVGFKAYNRRPNEQISDFPGDYIDYVIIIKD